MSPGSGPRASCWAKPDEQRTAKTLSAHGAGALPFAAQFSRHGRTRPGGRRIQSAVRRQGHRLPPHTRSEGVPPSVEDGTSSLPGVIAEISFEAAGCAICLASASMMTELLGGEAAEEARTAGGEGPGSVQTRRRERAGRSGRNRRPGQRSLLPLADPLRHPALEDLYRGA